MWRKVLSSFTLKTIIITCLNVIKMKTIERKVFLALILGLMTLFANAQEWQTDFDQAKLLAIKENRPIIMVFQGSDWCAPCIKLDREIWSSEEFKNYAKDNFIMLKVDFPRQKKNALSPEQQAKNDKLAEKYNKSGYFPHVVVVDKSGKVLGETGYKNITPAEYIKHLSDFVK